MCDDVYDSIMVYGYQILIQNEIDDEEKHDSIGRSFIENSKIGRTYMKLRNTKLPDGFGLYLIQINTHIAEAESHDYYLNGDYELCVGMRIKSNTKPNEIHKQIDVLNILKTPNMSAEPKFICGNLVNYIAESFCDSDSESDVKN